MSAESVARERPHEPMVFERRSPTEHSVSRVFHASRERVFQVFTDPKTIPSLWSDDPSSVTLEQFDARPGGKFAIVVTRPDGTVHRSSGEFLEVVPPSRLVNSWSRPGHPEEGGVETDTFETVPGGTRVTVVWKYQRREAIDRMLGPALEERLTRQWDRVAAVVEAA
jgi:uncharacterized protein YndB with AHSA1/START domain